MFLPELALTCSTTPHQLAPDSISSSFRASSRNPKNRVKTKLDKVLDKSSNKSSIAILVYAKDPRRLRAEGNKSVTGEFSMWMKMKRDSTQHSPYFW
jgi:hypothetical protein